MLERHLDHRSESEELRERLYIMLELQHNYLPDPMYIEHVQSEEFMPDWRRKIGEWLLQVSNWVCAKSARFGWSWLVEWNQGSPKSS